MKKTLITISLIVIIVGGAVFVYKKVKEKRSVVRYETEVAKITNIRQTVKETGTVESYNEVSLSFNKNGELAKKIADVGDNVDEGDEIAELDISSLILQKKEKENLLVSAIVGLQKLKNGASKTEIDVAKAQEQQALENYLSAKKNLEKIKETVNNNINQASNNLNDLEDKTDNTITPYEQAIATAEDSLKNTKKIYSQALIEKEDSAMVVVNNSIPKINTALDSVEDIITDDNLDGLLSAKNISYLNKTNDYYGESIVLLSDINKIISDDKVKTIDKVSKTIDLANKTADTLSYCYKAIEASITSSSFTDNALNALKGKIDMQITSINAIVSSLNNSKNLINSALIAYNTNVSSVENSLETAKVNLNNAIKIAKDNLASAKVGGAQSITNAQNAVKNTEQAWKVAKNRFVNISTSARPEDIKLAQLKVDGIKTSINLIEDQINDSKIISPIKGKVVKFNYEVGEQIRANASVASVLNEKHLKIEVYIPEVDIAKLSIGNDVDITLDAFGDDKVFKGRVKLIDPAETILQDVVYYKVTIEFYNDDTSRIKPGMTANVTINANQKNNVLAIPSRAIIEENNKKIVRVLDNGVMKEVDVKTGMLGDNGLMEIVKGLKAGDAVVTYVQ